jgi:phage/plasmid-associated DNA primase
MHEMESAIRQKAYEIWQAEGQPSGREMSHWLRAKEEVARPKPKAARQRRAAASASGRKGRT